MASLGLYEVDITPTKPVQTVGFGREDELSRGILHSLSAQVSIWQFGADKCCFVTIDHIGFESKNAYILRSDIADILSISIDKVMLCFSHTHSAPDDSIEIEYFNFLCMQVKIGVQKALNTMRPVKLAWGNAYSDIGMNRRASDNIDRRIGILKVVDVDSGILKLLLLRLTAHANVLKEDNYLISRSSG
ncbi:MAG: hypothetical protein K0R15_2685 [Clostridiales bacterium]|nr:hypothetical protein [Clostridiales bacterium]